MSLVHRQTTESVKLFAGSIHPHDSQRFVLVY